MIDIVDLALAVAQIGKRLHHRQDVLLAQRAHGIRAVELEPHVHLDPADRRQIVALLVEQEAVEQRLRGLASRRLAGTHDPVDLEQRLLVALDLVGLERVADIAAGADVVDVEQVQLGIAGFLQRRQQLVVEFVARFGMDRAGLGVDQLVGEILPVKILVADQQLLEPVVGELPGEARGDLLAGLDHHLAGLGIDQVRGRLHAAIALRVERGPPAPLLGHRVGHAVVELVQDLLAVEAEGIKQGGDRQLAPAVDADIDQVLGIELEVEPGAAIGNDAGGEQELA